MTVILGESAGGKLPFQKGYFLTSGTLHAIAIQAYERLHSVSDDLEPHHLDALVSILFSAAALEAFAAELAIHARSDAAHLTHVQTLKGAQPDPNAARFETAAQLLDETEEVRGSAALKYLLAKGMLQGEPYDKGAEPYQSLRDLFAARNAIVHMKPAEITIEPHRIVNCLKGRGLCAEPPSGIKTVWAATITTRAVARWACNVVPRIATSITLPTGVDHPSMDFAQRGFKTVV